MARGRVLRASPIDRGWSWVILASAVVVFSIAGGAIKNFGLLFADILHTFGKSATSTAFIPSLHFASLQFASFPANYLCSRYSIKKVVMFGGFTYSLGYFTTSFVPEMEYMYITAAIAGIGAGFCMSTTINIVTHYFDKYRAKAIGLVTCSTGMITFGLPHMYQYLQEEYGLRGEIMLIAGALLQICVGASFFRQPIRAVKPDDVTTENVEPHALELMEYNSCADLSKSTESLSTGKSERQRKARGDAELESIVKIEAEPMLRNGDSPGTAPGKGSKPKRSEQKIVFDIWIIKKPDFIVSAGSFFLAAFAFTMVSVVLPVHTEETTHSVPNKAILMMCIGGSEVAGKLLAGTFADLKVLKVRTIWSLSLTMCAIATYLLIFADSIISICVLAALWAAMGGSLFMLHTLTYVETLGLEKLTSCLAMANLFGGCANLFSSPLAGLVKDATGKWDGAFVMASGIFLASACFMQTKRIYDFLKQCKDT